MVRKIWWKKMMEKFQELPETAGEGGSISQADVVSFIVGVLRNVEEKKRKEKRRSRNSPKPDSRSMEHDHISASNSDREIDGPATVSNPEPDVENIEGGKTIMTTQSQWIGKEEVVIATRTEAQGAKHSFRELSRGWRLGHRLIWITSCQQSNLRT